MPSTDQVIVKRATSSIRNLLSKSNQRNIIIELILGELDSLEYYFQVIDLPEDEYK